MNPERNARERGLEVEIAGRRGDRTRVEHNEGLDRAVANVVHEIAEGTDRRWVRIEIEGVDRRPEPVVDSSAERGRLAKRRADQNEGASVPRLEVLRDRRDEARLLVREVWPPDRRAEPHPDTIEAMVAALAQAPRGGDRRRRR